MYLQVASVDGPIQRIGESRPDLVGRAPETTCPLRFVPISSSPSFRSEAPPEIERFPVPRPATAGFSGLSGFLRCRQPPLPVAAAAASCCCRCCCWVIEPGNLFDKVLVFKRWTEQHQAIDLVQRVTGGLNHRQ